jgi:hypothetical protein
MDFKKTERETSFTLKKGGFTLKVLSQHVMANILKIENLKEARPMGRKRDKALENCS